MLRVVVHMTALLVFALAGAGLVLAQQDAGVLVYGETATGVISDATPEHVYRFTAQADDVVTIALDATSGDLDALLILTDERGNVITQDDDSGGGRNSLIVYTIRTSGTYRIVATRYDRAAGATSGEYALALNAQTQAGESLAQPATPTLVPTLEVAQGDVFGELPDLGAFTYELIAYGDTVAGTISDEQSALAYAFGGRAGETVTLSAQRTDGDLALRLALFDRTGQTVLIEEEDTDGVGALELSHILPETAYYVVGVGRVEPADAEGSTAGDYELALDVVLTLPPAVDIVLEWDTVADLDLVVYYPSDADAATSIDWRNTAYPDEYPLPEGVTVSGDANGFCQDVTDQPSEQIAWEGGTAPLGEYEILVQYQFGCGSPDTPVEFAITLTVDGEVQTLAGTVAPPKGESRFAFAR